MIGKKRGVRELLRRKQAHFYEAAPQGAFLRSRAVRVTFRGSNCMVYVTAPPKALAQTRKEPRIPAILGYGPAAGGS